MITSSSSYAKKQSLRPIQEDEIFVLLKDEANKLRFEKKISPEPTSGCWLWTAAIGHQGHGQFFLKGKNGKGLIGAHRASWMMNRGHLRATDVVCHKCDNPYCVNPDHLFVGNHKDNSRDSVAKGRSVLPDAVGEANSAAILTEQNVAYIRNSKKQISTLAAELGVSKTTIWECRAGVTWKHLPGVHGKKKRNGKWTEQQDQIVLSGVSDDEVMLLTGRSRFSVFTRRHRLKKKASS